MVAYGGKKFNFIARIERLDDELPSVMETIFGTCQGVATRSEGRTNAHNSLAMAVTPEDRNIIERLYAQDYEMFE